jgi:hypothetical protein
MTELWKEHITLAVPLLVAFKANNKSALDTALKNWRNNAKKIAQATASLNSKVWDSDILEIELNSHINLLLKYAAPIIQNKPGEAFRALKTAEKHFSDFADILTKGTTTKSTERTPLK